VDGRTGTGERSVNFSHDELFGCACFCVCRYSFGGHWSRGKSSTMALSRCGGACAASLVGRIYYRLLSQQNGFQAVTSDTSFLQHRAVAKLIRMMEYEASDNWFGYDRSSSKESV
jgi:hypothetical protein